MAANNMITPNGSYTISRGPTTPTNNSSRSGISGQSTNLTSAPIQGSLTGGPGPAIVATNGVVVIQAWPSKLDPDQRYPLTAAQKNTLLNCIRGYVNAFGTATNVSILNQAVAAPTITVFASISPIEAADRAVEGCSNYAGNAFPFNGVLVTVVPVTNHLHLLRVSPYRAICELPVGTANGDMLIGRFERAIIRRHFPTGRGTDILDQNFLPNAQHLGAQSLASFDALFNESQPMLPYSYQNPGVARLDNNTVYSRKILDGNDVRTTIMLRNIPNSIKQFDLIKLLNDVVPGTFDFVYLRIDFQNSCNVGYGFINFVRADYILRFIEHVPYRRWANSAKMAEIKYATIQGVDALISKFRNSAVMQQAPSAQPKLFYSVHDTTPFGLDMVGHERPFPSYDNSFKLNQSMQNVSSIGLYSPRRHRSAVTSPNRTRRGHYDRGTTYDLHEQQHGTPTIVHSTQTGFSSSLFTPRLPTRYY